MRHCALGCVGTTDFREVAEFIDDDSDEEVEVKELRECLAKPLTKVPRVWPGELKTAPEETEDPAEESMKASRLTEPSVEPRQTEYFTLSPQKRDAAEAQLSNH